MSLIRLLLLSRMYAPLNLLRFFHYFVLPAVAVSDSEILEAMRLTGRKEAVLAEPSSAVTVAAVKKMLSSGIILPDESAACVISGNGVRDLPLIVQGLPEVPRIGLHDIEGLRMAVDACRRGE